MSIKIGNICKYQHNKIGIVLHIDSNYIAYVCEDCYTNKLNMKPLRELCKDH